MLSRDTQSSREIKLNSIVWSTSVGNQPVKRSKEIIFTKFPTVVNILEERG